MRRGLAVVVLALGLTSCGNVPHLPGHSDGNRQIAAQAVTR